MPMDRDPQDAPEIAQFGEAANPAASINYNVPLPGAHSFQRVVSMELPSGWYLSEAVRAAGTPISDLGVMQPDGRLDPDRLLALYQRMLPSTAQPSLRLAADVGVGAIEPQLLTPSRDGDGGATVAALASDQPQALATLAMIREDGRSVLDQGSIDIQRVRRQQFLVNLAERERQAFESDTSQSNVIQVPTPALGQSVQTVEYSVPLTEDGIPQIAIVETWQTAAFLGDYGLGRTLQTFSLLPGERTTITVESWRTDATTREDASSVFDSSDTAAQSRFSAALMRESGSAFQDQGGWSMSVGAQGGFNIGVAQASVETAFSANHQEARQQFSNSVSQTNQEHASQVNASRRQELGMSTSTTTATGVTQTTVRELSNTNLRRVLNFVFRELNQTYETVTSLRDVRIAFYNGHAGSAEIVPLADLRRLVRKYVYEPRQEDVARTILGMVVQCIDHEGTPQTTLEVGTRDGGTYNWEKDAALNAAGELDFDENPLDPQHSWRIKRDPIGQEDVAPGRRVPGVVTARDSIVLRTDNIVVEALLGQADALDPYATALQALDIESRKADIEGREAETRRTNDALDLVKAQKDAPDIPTAVDTFERFFGEKPDIEVNPDIEVAVGNDGNP